MKFGEVFILNETLENVLENTLIIYLDTLNEESLLENLSVRDACMAKNGKMTAITDEVIDKIKRKEDLEYLIMKLNMKVNLLKDLKACKKAIIDRYMANQKKAQMIQNQTSNKIHEEVEKIIEKIKVIIKKLIAKAKKWNIHIPFNESKNTDDIIENFILEFLVINQLKLDENIDFDFEKFKVLIENDEAPLAKLSRYILILKSIRNKIGDLLSKEEYKQLNNWIAEFTKIYNDLKKKYESLNLQNDISSNPFQAKYANV